MAKETSWQNARKLVEENRDILAELFSIPLKEDKQIDFEKVLKYLLTKVPLSLWSANVAMRKTAKSDLAKQVLSLQNSVPKPEIDRSSAALVADLMALICTMVQIHSTFEKTAVGMMSHIPKG